MRKVLTSIFFLFFFLPWGEGLSQTIGIYAASDRGTQGGTAFIASDSGDLVTAYHVVQGATSISLQDPEKGVIDPSGIMVRGVDTKRDLAVLFVPALTIRKGFVLKDRFPKPEESLKVIGYPRWMPNAAQVSTNTLIEGPITPANSPFRVRQGPLLLGDIELIPLNMTIYSGFSGSPLIDSFGQVIGVVSGSLNEGGSFAWAIPISGATAILRNTHAPIPLKDFVWPKLEMLAPYAMSSTRSYANSSSSSSFALRVEYRKALAKYTRATEELEKLPLIIESRVCSDLETGADLANQLDLEASIVSVLFNSLHETAVSYEALYKERVESSEIIRGYLREIAELPDRPDIAPSRAQVLKGELNELELSQPELFSDKFEDVLDVSPQSGPNWIAQLDELHGKNGISASQAREAATACHAFVADAGRYTFSIDSPDARLRRSEREMYVSSAKTVDDFADYLAFH